MIGELRAPEERLADRLVETLRISPPVDVRALLADHADIVQTADLTECDAVVSGLTDVGRPTVIINSAKPTTRQSFTMAHELGHILIPWHIHTLVCQPDESSATGNEEDTPPSRERFETEADRFAAALLLPAKFIDNLPVDPTSAIERLETARLSRQATLRSYAARQAPGLVLVVADENRQVRETYRSPGTPDPPIYRGQTLGPFLRERADRRGSALFINSRIFWYAFDPCKEVVPERPWADLLTGMLERADAHDKWGSIAGIAGSANGSGKYTTASQIASFLRQRFRLDPDLTAFTDDVDFDEFAMARAWSLIGLAD